MHGQETGEKMSGWVKGGDGWWKKRSEKDLLVFMCVDSTNISVIDECMAEWWMGKSLSG